MTDRKFGDVALLEDATGSLTVMYLHRARTDLPKSLAEDYATAVILSGETLFDGAVRGPGYIGPIRAEAVNTRWLDDS